jgi:glutamate carboxypeptidase
MKTSVGPTRQELVALVGHAREQRAAFLEQLAGLVGIDSGTTDPDGVDRLGEVLGGRLEALGARVERRRDGPAGRTLIARFPARAPGPRILVVGHLDTVFETGEAAARPLVIRDGRAYGPGSADMKGGLLLLVHALEAIRGLGHGPVPAGDLVMVASPDEEVGSPVGSIAIRTEAARADVALVLEPARPAGELIAARKGMLQARLHFTGRAAHAGVEPERGRSAVLAAAHATIALHGLTGRPGRVTSSVGTVRGGTRPNVVPDATTLEFDLRAATREAMADAEAAIAELCAHPAVDDVEIRLEPIGRFPPMERTEMSDALFALAVAVGQGLGATIRAVATGGASDANTIAELGVPVLDGLGPVGGGMHTAGESIEIGSIPERVALLGGLIVALGRAPLELPPKSERDVAPRG